MGKNCVLAEDVLRMWQLHQLGLAIDQRMRQIYRPYWEGQVQGSGLVNITTECPCHAVEEMKLNFKPHVAVELYLMHPKLVPSLWKEPDPGVWHLYRAVYVSKSWPVESMIQHELTAADLAGMEAEFPQFRFFPPFPQAAVGVVEVWLGSMLVRANSGTEVRVDGHDQVLWSRQVDSFDSYCAAQLKADAFIKLTKAQRQFDALP